ncbi:conserved hypothetical protein [Pediculus humanus corporis]|uniref:CRAL-TRIO domain-containing protein n=1 Tax=Pediculus humanus subsp. corporis TaxID=121224 RepID=E0W2C8_PEDHC|nr:uncharacterized protein Phum_PHUM589690 [Pediculus humanus corporis]EEB19784.1 conserved hypothetical protein [Pediculus humanus corporis]
MALTAGKHPFYHGCGEIPTDTIIYVNDVKNWMNTQTDIPDVTDEFIYMFLHSNYFDVEKTKKTIQLYFSLRCSSPDLFLNQSPLNPDIQSGLNSVLMVPLPEATPDGYKVVIFKLSDQDPNKFVHLNAAKAMILFNDVRLSEDGIVPGYIVVCDARGYTWAHLSKLNLNVLRVYMKYMQEAKPVRLKGLHVIYSAKIIDKLMTVAKPFMKSELQKLIKIHTSDNMNDFFNYVPQEIMPEDYGGKAKSLFTLHEENRILMEEKYTQWIAEEENLLKIACELRHLQKNSSSTESVGTFKSLSID